MCGVVCWVFVFAGLLVNLAGAWVAWRGHGVRDDFFCGLEESTGMKDGRRVDVCVIAHLAVEWCRVHCLFIEHDLFFLFTRSVQFLRTLLSDGGSERHGAVRSTCLAREFSYGCEVGIAYSF